MSLKNKYDEVFNKRLDLEKKRIKLNKGRQILDYIRRINNITNNLKKFNSENEEHVSNGKQLAKQLNKVASEQSTLIVQIRKQAKDLGLDDPKEVTDGLALRKEVQSMYNRLPKNIK